MLQLNTGVGRLAGALLAGILLICSYVLVGGGMKVENRLGAIAVAVGVPLYFASLTLARRVRLDWLVAGIVFVGVLAGSFIIVFTLVAAFDKTGNLTGDFPFSAYMSSVVIASLIGYVALGRLKPRNPPH